VDVSRAKTRLFYWFKKKGVKLIGGVKLEKITADGLSVSSKEINMSLLKADKICSRNAPGAKFWKL